MSVFSLPPRPRIVNGVLIKEGEEHKRHNGLQGASSLEEFYRALPKISPIPETDIQTAESVSPRYNFPCSHNRRQNCPNLENAHSPEHVSLEHNDTSGHLESHVVHSDNRQTFDPQQHVLTSPLPCALSNDQNHSAITKVDPTLNQNRFCSEICCEAKSLTPINKWESGDHHRTTEDNFSPLNEEDRHASYSYCCGAPMQCNANHPRYPDQRSSPPNAKGSSAPEECKEYVHHCTCDHPHDSSLMEDNTIYRTSNSTRLNEQMFDDSHENTEGCDILVKPQDICDTQNALQQPSSKRNDRSLYNETTLKAAQSHRSSPVLLHKSNQQLNSQDEELECEPDTAREACQARGVHSVEFPGYPAQRGPGSKQYTAPVVQDSANLRRRMQRRKKHDFLNSLEGKVKINVTEQEATSVAEILSHSVVDLQPDESDILVPHYTPPVRTQTSEDNLGYPPQPVSLGKSKYTVHKMNENLQQYEREFQPHYCCTRGKEIMSDWDGATANDPLIRECKENCATHRNEMAYANECEAYDTGRTYHETVSQHLRRTGNECENICAHCTDPEHCKKSVYRGCSPHKAYPEPQEKYYLQNHQPCCKRSGEETGHFCSQPNSRVCETSHYYHTNENENLIHASECREHQNTVPYHTETNYGYSDCHENVSNEDQCVLPNSAGGDELQARIEREKCNVQIGSSNYCDAQHITENSHSGTPDLKSKAAGDEPESCATPTCLNKPDEDSQPCHIEQHCTPDKGSGSSESFSPKERLSIVNPCKRNGLDDDDNVGYQSTIKLTLDEKKSEETKGTKKHRMLILQETGQTTGRQKKSDPAVTANNTNSKPGVPDEQKHSPNSISKARSSNEKADTRLPRRKSSTVAGCLQRSKRATAQVQNHK